VALLIIDWLLFDIQRKEEITSVVALRVEKWKEKRGEYVVDGSMHPRIN
jgi:hypothetical protein